MAKTGTVESYDGLWLVTWYSGWMHIAYEVQDQKTGRVFVARASGENWDLFLKGSPMGAEGALVEVQRDDPKFQSLLEALQRAYDEA